MTHALRFYSLNRDCQSYWVDTSAYKVDEDFLSKHLLFPTFNAGAVGLLTADRGIVFVDASATLRGLVCDIEPAAKGFSAKVVAGRTVRIETSPTTFASFIPHLCGGVVGDAVIGFRVRGQAAYATLIEVK